MARMNASTRESLTRIRRYLETSLVATHRLGNSGAGLKRWIHVLDDVLKTHTPEAKP